MKVEIEVPDDMDAETAKLCFLIGLKTYTNINQAKINVTFGVRGKDDKEKMEFLSFKGEYAFAVMKFCQSVRMLSGTDIEKDLAIMRDQGSDMLKSLQQA